MWARTRQRELARQRTGARWENAERTVAEAAAAGEGEGAGSDCLRGIDGTIAGEAADVAVSERRNL